jgi:hypothetical protein
MFAFYALFAWWWIEEIVFHTGVHCAVSTANAMCLLCFFVAQLGFSGTGELILDPIHAASATPPATAIVAVSAGWSFARW